MLNVACVTETLCDRENSTFYLLQQITEIYLGVSAVQSAALSNTASFCIRGMLRPTENIPRPCFAVASSNTANIATWTPISVISWNNSSRSGKQEQFQFPSGAGGNVLLLHCRPNIWVKSGYHGADGNCPPDTGIRVIVWHDTAIPQKSHSI